MISLVLSNLMYGVAQIKKQMKLLDSRLTYIHIKRWEMSSDYKDK